MVLHQKPLNWFKELTLSRTDGSGIGMAWVLLKNVRCMGLGFDGTR